MYQQSESVAVLLKYVFYHCELFSNYFNFLSIYQNSIISIQTFQCGQKDFKKWNNFLKIKSERRRFKNEKEFEKLKVFYFYLNKKLNALRCQLSKKKNSLEVIFPKNNNLFALFCPLLAKKISGFQEEVAFFLLLLFHF